MKVPSERRGCVGLVVVYYTAGVLALACALYFRAWAWGVAIALFYAGPTWWMLDTRPLLQTRSDVDLVGPEASTAEFSIEPAVIQRARAAEAATRWPTLTPPPDAEPSNADLRHESPPDGGTAWTQPPFVPKD